MLRRGERVLVAISGGPDSTATLAALAALSNELDISLRAAHLNHGLRGAEAVRDQQCAEMLAAQLQVPCTVELVASPLSRSNLEAGARAQRYAFLHRVAAQHACTRVATGHTLDDQAETVLMRLLRGAGPDGLSGIRAVRDDLFIRPLIDCQRIEVLAFIEECGLPYCHDSSNADRRFLRNRVRHEVLPLLAMLNPAVKQTLATSAGIAADESAVLDAHVRRLLGGGVPDGCLTTQTLLDAPSGLRGRIVRRWVETQRGDLLRITSRHVRAIVGMAQSPRPNARTRLPGGQEVVREYDRLRWQRECSEPVEAAQVLAPGAAVSLPSGWRISAELVGIDSGTWQRPLDLWTSAFDAQGVAAPLVVRTARPGDRLRPLGGGGHRKLQDIFVDRKWPLAARRLCPVVECAGEILWVPGLARSGAALITGATRVSLRMVAQHSGIAGP
jgi:tRNA(Ile)-lysidine synthase